MASHRQRFAIAKQRKVQSAVEYVQAIFPAGTKIQHRRTGIVLTIGVKSGASGFWAMQENPPSKGIISAQDIRDLYERADGG